MITAADILNAKILVVDDKEANVLLIEGMLRVAGYTAVSATQNPLEVCELHRQHRYDLILLDLQMPVMNGFEVMEGAERSRSGRISAGPRPHRATRLQATRARRRSEGYHQLAI